MSTSEKHSQDNMASAIARVREVIRQEVGIELSMDVTKYLLVLGPEREAFSQLTNAMTRTQSLIPPAMARAAQATENVMKSLADEFGLLTSADVAQLLGSKSKSTAARSLANDMRGRGELLAVRRLNKFLYPGFQFDHTQGRVKPLVKKLLQLAEANDWEPADVVLWLLSPTTYFEDESRPVDHFDNEPDLVLSAAQRAWAVQW